MDYSDGTRLKMNLLEITNGLSPTPWQAEREDADDEAVMRVPPWLSLTVLDIDVNMLPLVKNNL